MTVKHGGINWLLLAIFTLSVAVWVWVAVCIIKAMR